MLLCHIIQQHGVGVVGVGRWTLRIGRSGPHDDDRRVISESLGEFTGPGPVVARWIPAGAVHPGVSIRE